MSKAFIAYIFILFLSMSKVVPAYMSWIEDNFELVMSSEFGEEEENGEKSEEEIKELKLFQPTNTTTFFENFNFQKKVIYILKYYTSNYQKLESPPPELIV